MNQSSRESALDPVLARQLKRLGVSEGDVPDPTVWARLLEMVSDQYRRSNEDRAMLARSMDLSSAEFEVLRAKIENQRNSFRDTIVALNEALGVFGSVVRQREVAEDTGTTTIEAAKADFSSRLYRIFDAERDASATAEISGLSVNLVRLADQLSRLLESGAARAVVRKDLEVARAAQRLLVAAELPSHRGGLSLAGTFRPAAECGGDYWAVHELASDVALVLVGDVTGHGVSAAILAGVAKGACEAYLASRVGDGADVDPGALLQIVNRVVYEAALGSLLMTFTAAVVDTAARTVRIANAGHPHVLCVRPGEARPLVVDGPPLGSAAQIELRSETFACERDDALVWYTDGLVERENGRGETFGDRRLRAVCQRAVRDGSEGIVALVESTLETFADGAAPEDDATLVVATFA